MDNATTVCGRAVHHTAIFVAGHQAVVSMRFLLIKSIGLLLGFICLEIDLSAQLSVSGKEDSLFTCFNAQEIHFPLGANDFTDNQILFNEEKLNALYYLYQDKYSFWYKFVADENIDIVFSVSPSNENDRYRAMAFKYGGRDFCEKLVNENIEPISLKRAAMFDENDKITYRNLIEAEKGDTFFISVLSLNREDCGHFLYMEAKDEKLSFHAIHRPCYNFIALDVPDFGTARMAGDDVNLDVEFSQLTDTSESNPKPSDFSTLETIEVQSADESFVEVGDRLVLNKVFFYNNTYALKPEASEELNQLKEFLLANPNIEVEVQGHTANDNPEITPDPTFKGQGKEWNFKGSSFELSEKRAEAVKDFLVDNGVSKKRIKTKGFGDTVKRVPDAKTFEESEKNMRVEILVTK
ncbi:MAG: OmpA family protein [Cryomorphaceae bacterium]